MSTLHTDTLVTLGKPIDGSEPVVAHTRINTTEASSTPKAHSETEELIVIEPVIVSPNVSTTTVIEPVKPDVETNKTDTKVSEILPVEVNTEAKQQNMKAENTIAAVEQSDTKQKLDAEVQTNQGADPLLMTDSAHQRLASVEPKDTLKTTSALEIEHAHQEEWLPLHTDWALLAVFLLTSLIVLVSNRKAIKKATVLAKESSRPTMPTINPTIDVEFEKAKIVAQSRQQWIQTLRCEIAEFVSATNAIWDLHKIKDGFEDILTDMKDPQFAMKELYQWSCTYNKAIQDTEKLYAKIHLLINPNEEHSQSLSSLLDKTMVAIEAKKSPSKLNDEIVAITQIILKQEWQRVKSFS